MSQGISYYDVNETLKESKKTVINLIKISNEDVENLFDNWPHKTLRKLIICIRTANQMFNEKNEDFKHEEEKKARKESGK